jgi:hypothetical protein
VIGVGGRKRQKPTGVWTFQSRALLETERTKTDCSIQLTTGQHERPTEPSGMADSARQEYKQAVLLQSLGQHQHVHSAR